MEGRKKRFTSHAGAILVMIGSAIGLGNIWRFPYIAGENGGGAFIIVYLLFTLLIAVPALLSEMVIGRRARANTVGVFRHFSKKKSWHAVGFMMLFICLLTYAFYSVVGGWTLNYIVLSATGSLEGKTPAEIGATFTNFTTSSYLPLIYQFLLIGLSALIVSRGVQKGIERVSKILMPCFIVLLVALCVRALTLPGASAGVDFMLQPDFSKLTADSIIIALGQSLFSLSVGSGSMITYGAFVRQQENLLKTTGWVAFFDVLCAVLAGLAIFPAVFAFGMSPESGPSLIFCVLPNVFNSMPGGHIFAIIFFVILALASLTSTIGLLEVLVAWSVKERKWHVNKSVTILSLLVFAGGVLCSLSFGVLSDATIFGYTIFDFFELIAAEYGVPISALLTAIFVGWVLPKVELQDELSNQGSLKIYYFRFYHFSIRYIVPLTLIIILLNSIFSA